MDLGAMVAAVWSRKFRIILVTALLLVATYAALMFVPKMYESSASLLIEPRENSYTRANNDTGSAGLAGAEAAVSNQIELIKSRDTLLTLIKAEKLDEVPELTAGGGSSGGLLSSLLGKKAQPADVEETVLQNLNERLTVMRERDSNVVSLFVRAEDPVLAARIANGLANVYVRRRADLSLSDTAEASVWLNEQIKQLRLRVTDAENKVASYKVNKDLLTGSSSTSLLDQQLSTVAGQITSAQERKNTAMSRSALIRGLLAKGQALDGVPDVRDSATIQQLSQTKATLQGERAQKSATLLPNHPTIRALTAQIAEIDKQITVEGRRVADALDAAAEIEEGLEVSLQADLTQLKSGAGTATRETVNLNELEREAKAERDLLESYLLRYRDAVSRTDASSALPDVRVVTMAAPAVSPASPKTTLILIAVTIVSLALQIGSILFGELLSGRALTTRRTTAPAAVEPPAELALVDEPEAMAEVAPYQTPSYPDEQPAADRYEEPTTIYEPATALVSELPAETMEGALQPLDVSDEHDDAPQSEPHYHDIEAASEVLEDLPEPLVPIREPRTDLSKLQALSSDIALGEVRIVLLSSLHDERDSTAIAELLIEEALRNGLSVARVDAGSGQISAEPGVTDLSAGYASFGDVVHKSPHEGLAEVPWGHQSALDRRSMRPFTLVEALTDIYEFVVVLTGRNGMASALPVFAGIEGRLILALGEEADERAIGAARTDAAALGFDQAQVIISPLAEAEVA
jgi:uncharacterized protein involved in exopolysaccharide biosynthesis